MINGIVSAIPSVATDLSTGAIGAPSSQAPATKVLPTYFNRR